MQIILNVEPKAKKRHRSGKFKGRTITYDPQSSEKRQMKWLVASDLRSKGLLKPIQGPIEVGIVSYHPFPKSWPKKRVKSVKDSGSWKTSKPDCDNEAKFWFDVMNGIAYDDDAQIVRSWSEKRYSDNSRVIIYINPVEANMVNEHAITVRDKLSDEDIQYLVFKAQRLQKMDRTISKVFTFDNDDGSHIIFEVEDMKPIGESK